MEVELIFHKNLLDLDAGETKKRIDIALKRVHFPFQVKILSVTVMSRWLVVLADFQIPEVPIKRVPKPQLTFENLCFSAIAGLIVEELKDYAVRYRSFGIPEESESLIYKKSRIKK